MIHQFYLCCFLLLVIGNIRAQTNLINKSDYDRLVIVDEYNNNFSVIYGRIYKANLHDSIPQLTLTKEYKSPDSLYGFYKNRIRNFDTIQNRDCNIPYKKLSTELIDSLIYVINNPAKIYSVVTFFDMDTAWFKNNRNKLLETWKTKYNPNEIKKGIADTLLVDYIDYLKIAYPNLYGLGTSDYSTVTIAFENDTDTISISTNGQSCFRVPWESNTYTNYNPLLSKLISKILPDDIIINKTLLNTKIENFEKHVLNNLNGQVQYIYQKNIKKNKQKRLVSKSN